MVVHVLVIQDGDCFTIKIVACCNCDIWIVACCNYHNNNDDDNNNNNDNNNNDNNERISRAPFHVRHAQMC